MDKNQNNMKAISGTIYNSVPFTMHNDIWLKHALHPETNMPQTALQPTYKTESERITNEIHHLEDILYQVHNIDDRSHKNTRAEPKLRDPQSSGMGNSILNLKTSDK
ncbi:hypothetical protein JD969_08820 [Planctomycetota bacterium]|nr:hypothetical protein JD969_08820 [Planctomycetota bacterium]